MLTPYAEATRAHVRQCRSDASHLRDVVGTAEGCEGTVVSSGRIRRARDAVGVPTMLFCARARRRSRLRRSSSEAPHVCKGINRPGGDSTAFATLPHDEHPSPATGKRPGLIGVPGYPDRIELRTSPPPQVGAALSPSSEVSPRHDVGIYARCSLSRSDSPRIRSSHDTTDASIHPTQMF